MFFHRFDRGLGHISFNNFAEAVLPFTPDYAHMVTERPDFYIRQGCDGKEFFCADTRLALAKLMQCLFAGERQVECIRQELASRQNFDVRAVFAFIDGDCDDYIRAVELRDFFAQ